MKAPPLPPGFVLQGDEPPPLPEGFVLDRRKAEAPAPSYDPSEGMGGGEKFLVGMGHAFSQAGHGLADLGRRAVGLDVAPNEDEALYQRHQPQGWQATAGDITGNVLTRLPLAAIPGGIGVQMAAQGLGEAALTPGDLAERAKAGGIGAAGAGAGNVLAKTLGRIAKPIGDKAADTLALEARGIEPTFGQAMSQKGTAVGRALGGLEESALSVPLASGPLRASRQRAMEQWQGATREAALPPGLQGAAPESVDATRKLIGDAYESALQSERLPYQSVQYQPDMRALSAGRPISNAQRDLVEQTFEQIRLKNLQNPVPGAQPTAAAAHSTESEMKSIAGRYKASQDPAQQDLGHLFDEVAQDYAQVWRSGLQNPTTRNEIAALDKAYPQFAAIRQAAKTAGAASTEGVPSAYSPAVLTRAARTVDRTPNKSRYIAGNAPQQELARLGQTIQTKLPDSGTATRALTGTGILGGGAALGLLPKALAGGTALAAYGTRPVQQYLTGRAAPQVQEAIRRLLRERAGDIGAGGAGLADYLGESNAP